MSIYSSVAAIDARLRRVARVVRICLPVVVSAAGLPNGAVAQSPSEADATCPGTSCGQLVYIATRDVGEGIVAARFDPSTGRLDRIGSVVRKVDSAWIVASPHRAILYAATETRDHRRAGSMIRSFAVDKRSGTLTAISTVSSGGTGAAYFQIVSQSPPPAIVVANERSGQTSVVPLGPAGVLLAPVFVLSVKELDDSRRQRRAHPGGVAADPSGSFIFVADGGADRILVHRFDSASGRLTAYDAVALPPGSHPRHVVIAPDGRTVYANAEGSGDILILRWNAETHRLGLIDTISSRSRIDRRKVRTTELVLSVDARFMYASHTGEDAIVVYAVDPATGGLREIQHIASGGRAPSTLAFDPSGRWLAVANAGSGRIAVLSCEPATGKITPTGSGLAVASPTSVAWLLH